jgi:hypothetical protein
MTEEEATMTIDEYIAAILKDAKTKSPTDLVLTGSLLLQTNYAKIISEGDVVEIGNRLYFRENKLLPGSKWTRGERQHVDFLKKNTAEKPDFIGTFHTHPYAKRMGPKTSVGFSASDIGAFAENFPKQFPVMVNLVYSNQHIFLAFFRANTKVNLKELEMAVTFGGPDTGASYGALNKKKKSIFNDYMDKIEELNSSTLKDKEKQQAINALEEELTMRIPKYHQSLMNENMAMNVEYAEKYHYDFYKSEPVATVKEDSTVTLKLQSKPSN